MVDAAGGVSWTPDVEIKRRRAVTMDVLLAGRQAGRQAGTASVIHNAVREQC